MVDDQWGQADDFNGFTLEMANSSSYYGYLLVQLGMIRFGISLY